VVEGREEDGAVVSKNIVKRSCSFRQSKENDKSRIKKKITP
jgi:hypothetical protein